MAGGLQDVPTLDNTVCRPLVGPKFTAFAGREHPLFALPPENRHEAVEAYDLALYKSNFGDVYDPGLRRFSFESGAIYRMDADNREIIVTLIEAMETDGVQ